jgi:formylglycine-generating enzyme required for sulfatase activity
MTDPRRQRLRELFEQAIDLPPAAHAEFLARHCGGDAGLRRELERLLAGTPPDEFLEPVLGDPRPQQVGPFRVLGELGRGNHPVYRAERSGEVFALKVLSVLPDTSPTTLRRFERDGASAGRLQHPHIVRMIETGGDQRHRWIAMELVDGHDLGTELRVHLGRIRTAPILPRHGTHDWFREVARICRQAALAIACAHEAGIWHRDIKPANLLLDRAGNLKVTDFGIAYDRSHERLTRTGELAGTPHYMSPEQARQERHGDVDGRTDVWSLGVVLYELLTLDVPFQGETAIAVLQNVERAHPRPVRSRNPSAPTALASICARAMAKDRADSYQSAGELVADHDRYLAGGRVRGDRGLRWRRAARKVRQHPRLGLGAACVVAAATLLHAWSPTIWAAERRLDVERLRALVVQTSWSGVPPRDLRRAVNACTTLATSRLTTAEQEVVLAAELRLRELLQSEVFRLKQQLARTAGGGAAPDENRTAAIQRVAELLSVFPDSEELRALMPARPTMAVVNLQVAPDVLPAPRRLQVWHIELDSLVASLSSDEPLSGSTLLPVRPGLVRLVILEPDRPPREFTRTLRDSDAIDLVEFTGTPPPSDTPMTPYARRTFVPPEEMPWPALKRPFDVPAFELDRFEVSNRQFLAFLTATGRPVAQDWFDLVRRDPAVGDRPVVHVSLAEARAYAEWVGKRLPTWVEWAIAAAPDATQPFPWGTVGPDGLRGAVRADKPVGGMNWTAQFEFYKRSAADVGDGDGTGRPGGPLHLLGNVAELTDTPCWMQDGGIWKPKLDRHFAVGGAWYIAEHPPYATAALYVRASEIEDSASSLTRGFRCARSLP